MLKSMVLSQLTDAYARYRIKYPVHVFHHLPKCGGTSVRKALKQWFHVNDDYIDDDAAPESAPIDLRTLISHNCLAGHFGHEGQFLDQRYPQLFKGFAANRRYRVFTFLRDPIKMRCSLYRHHLKLGIATQSDLFSAIMQYNNYYARILHVTERDWQHKLNQYFFIGNSDQLQESFDLLALQLNKPKINLTKANTTHKNKSNTRRSLTEQQVAQFKAHNQLDYAIYEYARRRLATLSSLIIS